MLHAFLTEIMILICSVTVMSCESDKSWWFITVQGLSIICHDTKVAIEKVIAQTILITVIECETIQS